LVRRHDLQFAFAPIAKPAPPPAWLVGLLHAIGKALGVVAPLAPYIFWGGLIIGVVLVAAFVIREIMMVRLPGLRRGRAVVLSSHEPDWRPPAARARTLLRDADALAAEGRFAEAAHLLLFRSIDDIDERWPNTVGLALTARDIARHAGLPEAARQAFIFIARIVERSFFGGAPVGEGDFAACRKAYADFALGRA
jgi:hypothetical protein